MAEERRNGGAGRRDYDDINVALAEIRLGIKHIEDAVPSFVTQQEFQPVKLIAYGMVSLLIGALVVLIVVQSVAVAGGG